MQKNLQTVKRHKTELIIIIKNPQIKFTNDIIYFKEIWNCIKNM